jgi:hypothetical protein
MGTPFDRTVRSAPDAPPRVSRLLTFALDSRVNRAPEGSVKLTIRQLVALEGWPQAHVLYIAVA